MKSKVIGERENDLFVITMTDGSQIVTPIKTLRNW
jgi:hypothetical protein